MEPDLNFLTASIPPILNETATIDRQLAGWSEALEKSMTTVVKRVNDVALDGVLNAHEKAFYLCQYLKIRYKKRFPRDVDAARKTIFSDLRDLIIRIFREDPQEVLEQQLKQLEEKIPAKWWEWPRVFSVKPRFIILDPNTQLSLALFGKFEGSNYAHSLEFEGHAYQPISSSKNELTFEINVFPQYQDPHLISYTTGKLASEWGNRLISSTSYFRVLFGCLPNYLGKIRVVYVKDASKMKCLQSPFIQFKRERDWKQDIYTLKASENYQIVPDTSVLHWMSKQGRLHHQFVSQDSAEVTYNYCGQFASGGFLVTCEEALSLEGLRVERLSLGWGEKKSIVPRVDEKIRYLIFETFTGDSFKFFPKLDNTNPLINFQNATENGYVFEAINSEQLYSLGVEEMTRLISKRALELFAIQNSTH